MARASSPRAGPLLVSLRRFLSPRRERLGEVLWMIQCLHRKGLPVAHDVLVAIGSNPPLTTSGERTRGRLEQARALLGFEEVKLVNLFAMGTYRNGGVAKVGHAPEGWRQARLEIMEGLRDAEAVLLAYGVGAPSGSARQHHRQQVDWLNAVLDDRELPVYWMGGAPRHPSRWQRYTYRHHPDLSYLEGLKLALSARCG
jgi:hypothetical protein